MDVIVQFGKTELADFLDDGNTLPCYGKIDLFADYSVDEAKSDWAHIPGRTNTNGGGGNGYARKTKRVKAAKKICATCPARELCLQASVYLEPVRSGTKGGWRLHSGVWGGMDASERKFLLDR